MNLFQKDLGLLIRIEHDHAAHGEVGPDDLVHLGQLDVGALGHDGAQLAGEIPAHPEVSQERVHRVGRSAVIEVPQAEGLVVLAIQAPVGIREGVAGDLVPFPGNARQVSALARPGLDGRELPLVAQQRQPVCAGAHPERAVLELVCAQVRQVGAGVLADVDLDRGSSGGFGDDGQLGAGDLPDVCL